MAIAAENRRIAAEKAVQKNQMYVADKHREDDIMREKRDPHKAFLR